MQKKSRRWEQAMKNRNEFIPLKPREREAIMSIDTVDCDPQSLSTTVIKRHGRWVQVSGIL